MPLQLHSRKQVESRRSVWCYGDSSIIQKCITVNPEIQLAMPCVCMRVAHHTLTNT